MTMPSEMFPALAAPTPAGEIKQRKGPHGTMLDYVDARYVMDRLDQAAGPENWQDAYEMLPNGSVRGGIAIRHEQEWIWKWDVGDPSDIEPVKGAHSDAFKRAAVKWGIGRDLYGDHARPAQAPRTAPAPRQTPVASSAPPDDEPPPPVDPRDFVRSPGPGQYAQPPANTPGTCSQGHPWKTVPGGVSKRTGRGYDAFTVCDDRDHGERPR